MAASLHAIANAHGRVEIPHQPRDLAGVPAIELVAIDKSFGSVHAVRGVLLAIDKGAITGIVGENGAGKSTLMSILYGLYRADAGEIRVDLKALIVRHQHFLALVVERENALVDIDHRVDERHDHDPRR